jgi:hypothetical protein
MKRRNKKVTIIGSMFLIGFGLLLLLNNFQIFGDLSDFLVALGFGAMATIGFTFYFSHRQQWWVLFPSAAFLGLAGAAMTEVFTFLRGLEGTLFFFGLATAFWLVFLAQKKHWWAAIPAGVLSTLGFVATVDEFANGDAAGSILFLGLGLTFAMLWALRREHNTAWAKWPALGLMGIGLFAPISEPFFEFGWPIVLIMIGGWLIWKNVRYRPVSKHRASAPATPSKNGTHQQNGHHQKAEMPPNEAVVE